MHFEYVVKFNFFDFYSVAYRRYYYYLYLLYIRVYAVNYYYCAETWLKIYFEIIINKYNKHIISIIEMSFQNVKVYAIYSPYNTGIWIVLIYLYVWMHFLGVFFPRHLNTEKILSFMEFPQTFGRTYRIL